MSRRDDRWADRVSASGKGSSAAGRDYHSHTYHFDGERREIALTMDSLRKLISDNDALYAQCEAFDAQIDQLQRELAHDKYQLSMVAAEIQRLRNRPVISLDRHFRKLTMGVISALFFGAVGYAALGPKKEQRVEIPGARSTVTISASPGPSATLSPSIMTCSPGTYVTRLAVENGANAESKATFKLTELRSRMDGHGIANVYIGATPVVEACPSVVEKLTSSNWILWAGPFSSITDARHFCDDMGFRTDQNWDCYPLPGA